MLATDRSMNIQLDHSGPWASAQLTQAVTGQENNLSPLDTITLFVILLCLCPEECFEPFPVSAGGVSVDAEAKQLTLVFFSDEQQGALIVEDFLSRVSALGFGANGWTLNILKTGASLAIRTVELPDWEDF